MQLIKLSTLLVFIVLHSNAFAETYICSIKNVSKLNENGYFVSHGWKTNYLNREFTINRDSGKVLNTTALKERLSNFDATNKPIVIHRNSNNKSLKVFTEFTENGTYALFEMIDINQDKSDKPYFYHTSIGMILSGTCSVNNSQ